MNRLNPCARVFVPAAILASTGGVCFAAPVNDNFASATPLTAGVTASGTNVAASVQAGEPATHLQLTANLGTPTGLSVWYSYTSATDGLATFSVVGTGVGTAAAALQAGAYTGTAVNSLTRIASASAIAGTATAPGTPFASNLFEVHAGVPVYFQVTGNSAAGTSTFDITVTPYGRPGTIILPRYSSWEWLHPLDGTDPTTNANWAAKWKIYGDPTIPFAVDAVTPQRAPLAFAALDGAPGIAKDIGTPTTLATGNNAGYARAQFT
ncbi:MAG TPA: hypothetical protein VHM91_19875, partial [Verrucomicrobiales bacterium]|nr:hypothetical protein [Verrucomicrobiales bacterium]